MTWFGRGGDRSGRNSFASEPSVSPNWSVGRCWPCASAWEELSAWARRWCSACFASASRWSAAFSFCATLIIASSERPAKSYSEINSERLNFCRFPKTVSCSSGSSSEAERPVWDRPSGIALRCRSGRAHHRSRSASRGSVPQSHHAVSGWPTWLSVTQNRG